MKPSTIFFIIAQITIALSQKDGGPDNSEPTDDGRGSIPATELAKRNNRLFARACVPADQPAFGCSQGGYCWRKCGPVGEWCWLAASGGSGPWVTCSSSSQCSPGATEGTGCGKGDCDACGCSC